MRSEKGVLVSQINYDQDAASRIQSKSDAGVYQHYYQIQVIIFSSETNINSASSLNSRNYFFPTSSSLVEFDWQSSRTGPKLSHGKRSKRLLKEFSPIHMNGRMYYPSREEGFGNPHLAKMLSPDRLDPDPTTADNYNSYAYVRNNPLKFTDPSGWDWYSYLDENGKEQLEFFADKSSRRFTKDGQKFTWAGKTTERVINGMLFKYTKDGNFVSDNDLKKVVVSAERGKAGNPADRVGSANELNFETAQKTGGIDWGMVGNGTITLFGGGVSTFGGVLGIASGVAAPAGVAGVVLGVPTIGLGVANIIDGFQGGHRKLPSGPAEATDIGFGGDGTVGQVIDLFSGGLPKNTRDGLLLGYGLYNSNIGQSMFGPRPVFSSPAPSPFIMQRDNTNVVMPRFPR